MGIGAQRLATAEIISKRGHSAILADADTRSEEERGGGPDEPSRQIKVVVVVLTAVAALLALSTLTNRSIWLDEAYTVAVATAPQDRFLEDLAVNGGNMSLYLVFMRGWLFLGDSDWWLRLPSVLFAAACVPAFFIVARRFVSARAAIAGCALLTVSPPLMRHAQDARSYSLTVLLVIISWWAVLRLAKAPTTRSRSVYVVAAALVVYANILGLLFVGAQILWLIVRRRRDAILAGNGIALLIIPQLVMALGPKAQQPQWIPATTAERIGETHQYLAGTDGLWTGVLVASAWILGAFVAVRRREHHSLAPVVWVAAPSVGLVLVSLITPLLVPRYLVMVVPALALLLCIAWDALPRLGAVALFVVAAVSTQGVHTTLTRDDADWRAATELLLTEAESDEVVFFLRSRHLVEYYWNQQGSPTSTPSLLSLPSEFGPVRRIYGFDIEAARVALEAADGAWIVDRSRPFRLGREQELFERMEELWPERSTWSLHHGTIRITHYSGER